MALEDRSIQANQIIAGREGSLRVVWSYSYLWGFTDCLVQGIPCHIAKDSLQKERVLL
jgi:hypothetical protein